MADVDDSINKISLQDKVKLLESLKKVRESEIKKKGEKLEKEIQELEEKRKKEMKALEEELKQTSNQLDEEMFKAMDALFFGDRRRYLMNRARLERTQEVVDELSSASTLRGESFLYDISEKIFAGQNIKLQQIISSEQKGERSDVENRGYLSSQQPLFSDSYRREDEGNKYESGPAGYPEPNPSNYSSKSKSWLEKISDEWGERRNY